MVPIIKQSPSFPPEFQVKRNGVNMPKNPEIKTPFLDDQKEEQIWAVKSFAELFEEEKAERTKKLDILA